MQSMQLNVRDIIELQSQQNNPMVSIFVPLTPHQPRKAAITLRNLIRETERRLNLEFTPKETASLLLDLRDRAGSTDLTRGHGSVAIFASAEGTRVLGLPYEVRPEVVIDESYATRNLVHALQRAPRYLIVVIDEGVMRCFELADEAITELADGALTAPDDPSPGVGWHGLFASGVDELLDGRQAEDLLPIILLAPPTVEAAFLKRSMVRRHVVASSTGRFAGATTDRVGDVALRLVNRDLLEDRRDILRRLAEARDLGSLASGIHAVWEAAHRGRVSLIVVEESLQFPAKLGRNGVLVEVSDATLPGVIDDAVDEVVEIALRHDAELRFVGDGALPEWGRVAAVTRW